MSIEIPPIVSVDDHVIEPPHVWETWLPAKYKELGPKVRKSRWNHQFSGRQGFSADPNGPEPESDFWFYGGFSAGTDVGMASGGLPPDEQRGGTIGFDQMRPGCWQLKERLRDMDENGVERSLC